MKLSSFHGKFSYLLFIFALSLLLHFLFFLIWLKPSGCCSHKVQFLTFIPPKPQPHLSTSRSSLRNAVVEMGQHPYDFFSKFLCVLFSYIYILIRIISLAKALGHTEKKNERNKRGLHVDTWVFLTLLRASLAVLGTALYLHMWRAKMKIYCSSISSSDSSNCQNATVTFHK